MNIINSHINSDLLDYTIKNTHEFRDLYSSKSRKTKGQFFTSKSVACFMASLFNIKSNNIRILDPGAGTGILFAALCDRIIAESTEKVTVTVDCYDNDPLIFPYFKKLTDICIDICRDKGHTFNFNLINSDFILDANIDSTKKYDFIISNPPYYKIGKNSPEALSFKHLNLNPPNIYTLFMVLSGMMLKPNGEMVFIVPRSFCSGLYYKHIRKWLKDELHFERIHLFESRKNIFEGDDILQETIILKATPNNTTEIKNTIVSHCYDKNFSDYIEFEAFEPDIFFCVNDECYIRIPSSKNDLNLIRLIDDWKCDFKDLGLSISTGPVVDFRTKENLKFKPTNNTVPLLWMHNLKNLKVIWDTNHVKKPNSLEVNSSTEKLFVPIKNYVLLKRFTSKEQKHRLDSSVFLKSDFDDYKFIGFENHLNYIYKKEGCLSNYETYGLAAVLKNSLIDSYFRCLNGNTQVNASEIRNLPLPTMEKIKQIGKYIVNNNINTCDNFDDIVSKYLNIDFN